MYTLVGERDLGNSNRLETAGFEEEASYFTFTDIHKHI